MLDLFKSFLERLQHGWELKVVVGFLVGSLEFLIGNNLDSFKMLCMLVCLDALTKLVGLSIIEGKISWKVFFNRLCSSTMRNKTFVKIIVYGTTITMVHNLVGISSDFGLLADSYKTIMYGVVFTFLALTECISILENLTDMGFKNLQPLIDFFKKKIEDLLKTGGK